MRQLPLILMFGLAFPWNAQAQTTYYWAGDLNSQWNANSAGNTNWSSALSTVTEPGGLPGSVDTVVFGLTPTAAGSPRALNLNTQLGADFTIAGLQFLSAGGFGPTATVIGVAAGTTQTLTLGSGGLTIASGAGPVAMLPGLSFALSANQTWTNNSGNSFTFGNPVAMGANTLTLRSISTDLTNLTGGVIQFNSPLTATGSGPSLAFLQGVSVVRGVNTGLGNTSTMINGGAAVVLGYAGNTVQKLGTGALNFGSGTLQFSFNPTTATPVTFGGLNLTGGQANFAIRSGALPAAGSTLSLGAINPLPGGTVNFTTDANLAITTTTANTGTSILGGWATVNNADWAVSGTGGGPFTIAALPSGSYTPISGATPSYAPENDVTVATAFTALAGGTMNSLRITAPTANTITNGQILTIASGGILVSHTTGTTSINGTSASGTLRPGVGQDLYLNVAAGATLSIGVSSANNMGISNPISGTSNLVISGGGIVVVPTTSAFTIGGAGKSIIVNASAFRFASLNQFSSGTSVVLNGGTFGFMATGQQFDLPNEIVLNDVGGNAFDQANVTASTARIALTGVVSGPGSLRFNRSASTTSPIFILQNVGNTYGGPGRTNTFASGTYHVVATASADALGHSDNAIILNGGNLVLGGAAGSTTSSNARPITVSAASGLGVTAGWTLNLTGPLAGSGTLSLNNSTLVGQGGGTTVYVAAAGASSVVQLNGDASAFTGGLTVTNGQLRLGNNFIAPAAGFGAVSLAATNGVLDLNGKAFASNGLASTSATFQVTNTAGTAATLTNTNAATFNGIITSTGVINVVKAGTGQWSFNSTNAFTGSTTIIGGSISLGTGGANNGAFTGTSGVTIGNGASLVLNSTNGTPFGAAPTIPVFLGGAGLSGGTLTGTLSAVAGPLTAATGNSIVNTVGGQTVTFASLSRNPGATVNFTSTATFTASSYIAGTNTIGSGTTPPTNLRVGTSITGSGIASGAIVVSYDNAGGPLTLSANTTSAQTSATLTYITTNGFTNFTANPLVNGILGPWASFAGYDYATATGSGPYSVVPLNAAPVAAEGAWTVADNINIGTLFNLTADRTVNTLRNTSAGGTMNLNSNTLTVNGLLQNGTGSTWQLNNGTITAPNNEFVLLGNTNFGITLGALLQGNAGANTALTVSLANVVTLNNAGNRISNATVNSGTVNLPTIASLGSSALNTTAASAAGGATALTFGSVAGFAIGQTLSGPGLAPGTTITAIDGGTNTITLSNALTSTVGSGVQFAAPSGGTLFLNGGAISPNAAITSTIVKAITVSGSGRITPAAAGSITTFDTQNITLNANSTLTFGNPGNNTSAGTFHLNPTSGKITGSGSVNYGGGGGTSLGTFFNVYGNNDYNGGTNFAQQNSGTGPFRVGFTNNNAFGTGTITLAPGPVGTANGPLNLESLHALAPNLTIANPIRSLLSSANSTLNLGVAGAGSFDFTLSGPISLETTFLLGFSAAANRTITLSGNVTEVGGSRPVTISGPGAILLSGANAYTGATTVRSGSLIVGANAFSGSPGALGSATSAVALGDASTLAADSIALLTSGPVTIGRSIAVGAQNTSGTTTLGGASAAASAITGNISLARNVNLAQVAGGTATFGGVISGTGFGIAKTDLGTVALAAANTYTGATTVNAGTLQLAVNNALPSASATTLNGGTLAVTPGTTNAGGILTLSANSTIDFGNAGSATVLSFADSSGATWAGSLTVNGYTGQGGGLTGAPTTQLFVGSTAAGLTAGQLASINFTGYGLGATQLSTGEVVPLGVIPEPGTILGLAAAGLGLAGWIRRRLR
jgi:autotransporter-associated beta strand protein